MGKKPGGLGVMKSNIIPAYICDYKRVKDCLKSECQKDCFKTLKRERAKLDEKGKPIIAGFVKIAD